MFPLGILFCDIDGQCLKKDNVVFCYSLIIIDTSSVVDFENNKCRVFVASTSTIILHT